MAEKKPFGDVKLFLGLLLPTKGSVCSEAHKLVHVFVRQIDAGCIIEVLSHSV